jgi:DNA-binding MarR family transcriptional regulator
MAKEPAAREIKFPFKSREELEAYLPYLITRLAHRWATDQNAALCKDGLQGAKMRMLSCLSAFGELTINELSILSVTEQSTTSRTVEQLVSSGLAERNISQSDQRVRTVRLTQDGTSTLMRLAPTINDLNQNLLRDVDQEELQNCVNVLGKMLKNIKKNQI